MIRRIKHQNISSKYVSLADSGSFLQNIISELQNDEFAEMNHWWGEKVAKSWEGFIAIGSFSKFRLSGSITVEKRSDFLVDSCISSDESESTCGARSVENGILNVFVFRITFSLYYSSYQETGSRGQEGLRKVQPSMWLRRSNIYTQVQSTFWYRIFHRKYFKDWPSDYSEMLIWNNSQNIRLLLK